MNRENSWEFTDRFQFFIRLRTLTTIYNNHKTKQTIDKKRWYFCHHLCEKKLLANSLPNGNPFQIRNPTNNQIYIELRNVKIDGKERKLDGNLRSIEYEAELHRIVLAQEEE